jgi:hypothetical protein
MALGKQVCSFELAKKLKGFGIEQRSLWYWIFAAVPPFHDDAKEHSAYEWKLSQSRPDFGKDQEIEDTTDGYARSRR